MPVHRHSIFEIQKEKLGGYLYLSVFSHLMVGVTFFLLPSFLNPSPDPWGGSQGGGGSMAIGLVDQSSIRGLNLPRPKQTTASNISHRIQGPRVKTEEAKAARTRSGGSRPQGLRGQEEEKAQGQKDGSGLSSGRLPKPKTVAQAPPPSE